VEDRSKAENMQQNSKPTEQKPLRKLTVRIYGKEKEATATLYVCKLPWTIAQTRLERCALDSVSSGMSACLQNSAAAIATTRALATWSFTASRMLSGLSATKIVPSREGVTLESTSIHATKTLRKC
jgi:hypothetical protein